MRQDLPLPGARLQPRAAAPSPQARERASRRRLGADRLGRGARPGGGQDPRLPGRPGPALDHALPAHRVLGRHQAAEPALLEPAGRRHHHQRLTLQRRRARGSGPRLRRARGPRPVRHAEQPPRAALGPQPDGHQPPHGADPQGDPEARRPRHPHRPGAERVGELLRRARAAPRGLRRGARDGHGQGHPRGGTRGPRLPRAARARPGRLPRPARRPLARRAGRRVRADRRGDPEARARVREHQARVGAPRVGPQQVPAQRGDLPLRGRTRGPLRAHRGARRRRLARLQHPAALRQDGGGRRPRHAPSRDPRAPARRAGSWRRRSRPSG